MECWFAKIPSLEWWDLMKIGIGAGLTYLVGTLLRSPLHDRAIIDDLDKIRKIMLRLEEIQDDKGQLDLRKIWGDNNLDDMFQDVLGLLGKHKKPWVYVDESTPNNQKAKRVREEANKSIGLIRRYGYIRAKWIRKRELRNSSQKEETKWDVQKLYPKKKH